MMNIEKQTVNCQQIYRTLIQKSASMEEEIWPKQQEEEDIDDWIVHLYPYGDISVNQKELKRPSRNTRPSIESDSLFNKQVIVFDDEVIEHNIDVILEQPLKYQVDPELEKQEQDEDAEHQQSDIGKSQNHQTNRVQEEALYNPQEDDDNQQWLHHKNIKKNIAYSGQKPLVCPSCFQQLAYHYHQTIASISASTSNSNEQDKEDDQEAEDKNAYHYHCSKVNPGIVVRENKIIRNRNASINMVKPTKRRPDDKNRARQEQEFEEDLQKRYEEINIKIICECECGADLGYYDVNQQIYVLINVI